MADTIAASLVADHPFSASPSFELCAVCGLSQAAHRETASPLVTVQNYRCPDCVTASEYRRREPHSGFGNCPPWTEKEKESA